MCIGGQSFTTLYELKFTFEMLMFEEKLRPVLLEATTLIKYLDESSVFLFDSSKKQGVKLPFWNSILPSN